MFGVNDTFKSLVKIVNSLPESKMKRQLEEEIKKVKQEIISDKARNVLSSDSFFVAGGIPSLIWVGAIAIFSNFILMPWAVLFNKTIPNINLPEQYWSLLGWIIAILLTKKTVDNNEFWIGGNLLKPSRSAIEATISGNSNQVLAGKNIVNNVNNSIDTANSPRFPVIDNNEYSDNSKSVVILKSEVKPNTDSKTGITLTLPVKETNGTIANTGANDANTTDKFDDGFYDRKYMELLEKYDIS